MEGALLPSRGVERAYGLGRLFVRRCLWIDQKRASCMANRPAAGRADVQPYAPAKGDPCSVDRDTFSEEDVRVVVGAGGRPAQVARAAGLGRCGEPTAAALRRESIECESELDITKAWLKWSECGKSFVEPPHVVLSALNPSLPEDPFEVLVLVDFVIFGIHDPQSLPGQGPQKDPPEERGSRH